MSDNIFLAVDVKSIPRALRNGRDLPMLFYMGNLIDIFPVKQFLSLHVWQYRSSNGVELKSGVCKLLQ